MLVPISNPACTFIDNLVESGAVSVSVHCEFERLEAVVLG
jgi:hypothetical protein